MLESMTGIARRSVTISGETFHIYLKSINHKYLESSLRLSGPLRHLEDELSLRIRKLITRGRVEGEIQTTMQSQLPYVDHQLMDRYAAELGIMNESITSTQTERPRSGSKKRSKMGGESFPPSIFNRASLSDLSVGDRLRMLSLPGVVTLREAADKFPFKELLAEFDHTLDDLLESRRKEGAVIESLFHKYLTEIEKHAATIKKLYERVRKDLVKRLRDEIPAAFGEDSRLSSDWSNAIVEWYDKNDIAEELERIAMHTSAIKEIMKTGSDGGRRIEFFAQELLRETNTIGAKSRDFQIRSRVVEIKNLIEKLKEQVRNVC